MSEPTKNVPIYITVHMPDAVGQLKVVLDARLNDINIERKPDGTGHIYGNFAPEASKEAIERLIEAKKTEMVKKDAAGNGETAPEPKAKKAPKKALKKARTEKTAPAAG
jgi:hypothetical protein